MTIILSVIIVLLLIDGFMLRKRYQQVNKECNVLNDILLNERRRRADIEDYLNEELRACRMNLQETLDEFGESVGVNQAL
jgi:hypothetical protein